MNQDHFDGDEIIVRPRAADDTPDAQASTAAAWAKKLSDKLKREQELKVEIAALEGRLSHLATSSPAYKDLQAKYDAYQCERFELEQDITFTRQSLQGTDPGHKQMIATVSRQPSSTAPTSASGDASTGSALESLLSAIEDDK